MHSIMMHPHPPAAMQPNLDHWREQQDQLAEQRELDDLLRKIEAKKLETRKWVLDQQRYDRVERPPHERRTTAIATPATSSHSTPNDAPAQPRSKTPTQPRSRTPGSDRPQLTRRATERPPPPPPLPAVPVRPTTPTPRPRVAQRSGSSPSAIPAPKSTGSTRSRPRTADKFSPEVEAMRAEAEATIRAANEAWMRDWHMKDEQLRTRAATEQAKTRAVQDSVRRMQAKLSQSPSSSGHTQPVLTQEARTARAFASYCERWNAMVSTPPDQLTFATIPWPVVVPPSSPADITLAAVSAFLLSPTHSHGKTTRQRARDAMRLWHPDKWLSTWLIRVRDYDRPAVIDAVNAVARHLNALSMTGAN